MNVCFLRSSCFILLFINKKDAKMLKNWNIYITMTTIPLRSIQAGILPRNRGGPQNKSRWRRWCRDCPKKPLDLVNRLERRSQPIMESPLEVNLGTKVEAKKVFVGAKLVRELKTSWLLYLLSTLMFMPGPMWTSLSQNLLCSSPLDITAWVHTSKPKIEEHEAGINVQIEGS